jgi:hypothetical protein
MIQEIIVALVGTQIGCMYELGIGPVAESHEMNMMLCTPMRFALVKNICLKII